MLVYTKFYFPTLKTFFVVKEKEIVTDSLRFSRTWVADSQERQSTTHLFMKRFHKTTTYTIFIVTFCIKFIIFILTLCEFFMLLCSLYFFYQPVSSTLFFLLKMQNIRPCVLSKPLMSKNSNIPWSFIFVLSRQSLFIKQYLAGLSFKVKFPYNHQNFYFYRVTTTSKNNTKNWALSNSFITQKIVEVIVNINL